MKTITTNNFGIAANIVEKFNDKVNKNLDSLIGELAIEYKNILVEVIEEQPDSWPELSEEWKEWKARNAYRGISESKWIAKGDLIMAISIHQVVNGFFVGWDDRIHKSSIKKLNSRITMGRLARVLEKGFEAKNIPARPLLGEANKRFQKVLNKKFKGFSDKIKIEMMG